MSTIRRRSSSLGAGRWSSVPAASTSAIASSSSRPYFFSRRTSSRRSSPSAGLRASSPSRTARARISESRCRCELIVCGRSGCSRAAATVDQRLADRQRCLDPAVLGELAVEVGLDVAARQFGHGDVAEVRQQVDLELALHVGQAVRAQPLADLALVVLVGELRDRRDFALDVVGLQRRAPGPGENLAGDQPRLVLGAGTIHALVAAPEADRLGRVAAAAEPHAVAHDAVDVGVLADLPGRLAGHATETATGEGERATRPLRSGLPRPPGRHRPRVAPAGACRLSAARRHGGCATARSVRSRA